MLLHERFSLRMQVSKDLVGAPTADELDMDSWSWRFDALLHNASQQTVYEEQVAPVVRRAPGVARTLRPAREAPS